MPAAVTGVGPVCCKKDCSCYEPQFAFRFTTLIQLILLRRNGHTYLLMERFLLTPTPSPLFIFCSPLFPMWPQTPMYKVEIESDHCLELTPKCIGIINEIATVNIKGTFLPLLTS